MRLLSLGIAAAIHAVALVAAGFVWIDLPREKDTVWGDGRIDVSVAQRELPVPAEVFVREPALRRDVVPGQRPEFIEVPETLAAADGDETDVTLPEGGEPPPAPSIAVYGGPSAPRPSFSTFARPGAWHGGKLGRGRRGATGDGRGTALHATPTVAAAVAPAAAPPAAPPREPELVAARLLEHPTPGYPESARAGRIEGVVRLEVDILEDASIGDIRVVASSGSDLLDAAAIAGVRRWKFAAATCDGEPVRACVRLPAIRFRVLD